VTAHRSPGFTQVALPSRIGETALTVNDSRAFASGRSILVGDGLSLERADVLSVETQRLILVAPLVHAHAPGAFVTDTGPSKGGSASARRWGATGPRRRGAPAAVVRHG
jgi:hypothetical protein